MPPVSGLLAAILPCADIDETERFYLRLGFARVSNGPDDYRVLANAQGGVLHLRVAEEGWLERERNPFGLYLHVEDVDAMAKAFQGEIIEKGAPHDKEWGMYEFALSDPGGTLVRIGWPSRKP